VVSHGEPVPDKICSIKRQVERGHMGEVCGLHWSSWLVAQIRREHSVRRLSIQINGTTLDIPLLTTDH
jgi:hypothetical protein